MMQQSSYPVPPWMFGAVQSVESGGDPNAVSPAGAGGLMQIMPDTARQPGYGVQPLQGWDGVDPRTAPVAEQQRFGNDYLQAMSNHFQGNQQNALMAYNGGPGRVDKLVNGQISANQLPAETQAYPGKVMAVGNQYAQNENIQTDAQPDRSRIETELKLKAIARLRLQGQQQLQQPEQPDNRFMGNEPGFEHAGLLPFKTNTKTGENVWWDNGFVAPEFIRSPVRGMQDLESTAANGDVATGNPNITPDAINAMASMLPFVGGIPTEMSAAEALKPNEPPAGGGGGPTQGFLKGNSSDPFAAPVSTAKPANMDAMYDKAGEYFDAADKAKAIIGAPKIRDISSSIKADLEKSNFDSDFHPQTAKWLDKFDAKSTDSDGNPIDMPWSKVNGMRKLLNGVIKDGMKQGGTEDSYQAGIALRALDRETHGIEEGDLTGGNPAAINLTRQGNTLWSAASKADEIQKILDKGQNAVNPATVYKNGLTKLAQRLKINSSGYTPEEIAAVNQGAKTGIVEGALRTMGSKIISGLAGAAGGAVGGGLHGALTGAAIGEGIGFPFRAGANAMARGGGENVQEMIGMRPAVQAAMQGSAEIPTMESPPVPPMLMLPAPEVTNIGDTAGHVIPLTPAGREIIGQSPSTASEQLPIKKAQSDLDYSQALEQQRIQQNAMQQSQAEQLSKSNPENLLEFIANSVQKHSDAGLPIGSLGEELMKILGKRQ